MCFTFSGFIVFRVPPILFLYCFAIARYPFDPSLGNLSVSAHLHSCASTSYRGCLSGGPAFRDSFLPCLLSGCLVRDMFSNFWSGCDTVCHVHQGEGHEISHVHSARALSIQSSPLGDSDANFSTHMPPPHCSSILCDYWGPQSCSGLSCFSSNKNSSR